MGNLVIRNSIRWIILVGMQLMVFSNMSFYNLNTPFIYVLFILWLPFEIPQLLLFLLAFGTGYFLDFFYDTPGVHAAACTTMALVRIIFINLTFPSREEIDGPEPTTKYMNRYWFFLYSGICITFHHLTFYLLETYKLNEIKYTLTRVALSTVFTLVLVLLINFVLYKKSTR